MKVQCPECKAVQEVPDPYLGKQVKCTKCQKPFITAEYKPVVIAQKPDKTPKQPPKPSKPPTGEYLCSWAVFCLLFSFIALILGIVSGDGTAFYRSVICILLSLVLLGIRSVIQTINYHNEKKE